MKKFLVFALLVCVGVSQASAAIVMTGHKTPVIENGFAKWTLTFEATSAGGQVAGFAGTLDLGTSNGFAPAAGSSMKQSTFPVATPTMDLNAAIPDAATDSQFQILSGQINAAVAPFESASTLGGAFALSPAARGTVKALVQVVAPATASNKINYSFGISEAVGDVSTTTDFAGTLSLIPEPGSIALAGMGLIGMVAARRRRIA